MGLALSLREGTAALHQRAESAGVVAALLKGRLVLGGYVLLQRNLHAIYKALEHGLQQQAAHPWLAPLHQPALARCHALTADLNALHGPQWAAELPLTAVARSYATRLDRLVQTNPGLLAAHAYVRYMGDLAGGQALRRIVRRGYALPGEAGTHFFDFGLPSQVAALSRAFREGLDAIPADAAGIGRLVAEAQWAFEQHVQLFEALAALPAPVPGTGTGTGTGTVSGL